jgi:hypothetical protein
MFIMTLKVHKNEKKTHLMNSKALTVYFEHLKFK